MSGQHTCTWCCVGTKESSLSLPFQPVFAACTSRVVECSRGWRGKGRRRVDVLPCQSSVSLISGRILHAPTSVVDAPKHLYSWKSRGLTTLPLCPPTVCVHRHCHPPPLLLHVHLRLDVRGGPTHLSHADRAAEHQPRPHQVLLRHGLGHPGHYHR